jgi:putative membrane protein
MTAKRLSRPGSLAGAFFCPVDLNLQNRLVSLQAARPHNATMLWIKAFHIIFVASWFAGLFYMPRIFVNLAMVPQESHAERERLLLMAHKLYRFMTLLMIPALVLGVWLWLANFSGFNRGWLHLKLALVVGVIGYHHFCGSILRSFELLANRRSHRWFRVFNETAVLLFAAIVILVVVKPF